MQRLRRKKIGSQLIGLGLLIVIVAITTLVAYNAIHSQPSTQFSRIEQPFLLKLAVTLAGLTLICLELSWFLLSQDRVNSKLASQTLLNGRLKQLRIVARGGWRSNFSSRTLRSLKLPYQGLVE